VSIFIYEVDDDKDPTNKPFDYTKECGPSKTIVDYISPSLRTPVVGVVLVLFLYT
jgi:hypothetical protein